MYVCIHVYKSMHTFRYCMKKLEKYFLYVCMYVYKSMHTCMYCIYESKYVCMYSKTEDSTLFNNSWYLDVCIYVY